MHPVLVGRGRQFFGPAHARTPLRLIENRTFDNGVGLRVDSKAQAEQVRSVSVERLGPAIGYVPTHLMTQLDDALRLHLQLDARPPA